MGCGAQGQTRKRVINILHTSITNTQLAEEAQERACGGRKMDVDGGGRVRGEHIGNLSWSYS
jgi:hypothetical protein